MMLIFWLVVFISGCLFYEFVVKPLVGNLLNKYSSTYVGKLDKKLDDKYEAWLDKIFK
jgi:hypothetical protein